MKVNELIKNVKKYQETKEDYVFEAIIDYFQPCINKQINKIDKFYKDDVKQEILNGIYCAINKFKVNIVGLENISKKEILSFKKKYLINENLTLNEIVYQYQLLNNENQFKKYIKNVCANITKTFYKNNVKNKCNQTSLNKKVYDDEELIDLVIVKKKEYNDFILKKLTKEELEFIKLFLEDGILLKGKEVAKKLGISPQAVSAKKLKIIKKYKKM